MIFTSLIWTMTFALIEFDSEIIWWYGLSWRLLPLMLHPTHGGFAALREGVVVPLEVPLGMMLLPAGGGVEGGTVPPGSGGFLAAMAALSEMLLRAFTWRRSRTETVEIYMRFAASAILAGYIWSQTFTLKRTAFCGGRLALTVRT